MNILVTGGTGFLGRCLVEELVKGNNVIVFGRTAPDYMHKRLCFVEGDILDPDSIEKIRKVDVVYHLAASLDETDPEMAGTNATGTKNIVEFCKKRKVKRLIYMSSAGVLGETLIPASETFPYKPQTAYEKSKMKAEKIIRASRVPFTIIRASIIIGPNEIWAKIFKAAKKRYPIIGSGKNHFHLTHINDAVNFLLLVKNNDKARNEIFHIATKDTPTYEQVYELICKELKTSMTEKHISIRKALLMANLYYFMCVVEGKKPPLTKRKSSIYRLVRNRWLSTKKAEKVLNFVPNYDTRKAVRETAKALKRIGLT